MPSHLQTFLQGNYNKYEYFESIKNSSTRSEITPKIVVQTIELEMMYKLSERYIYVIIRPIVLFIHNIELKNPDLAYSGTDSTKNLQDKGATPPLITQPS